MTKKRKLHSKSAGWMLAVMFNSLLILVPVIASEAVRKAYEGVGVADQVTSDAIRQTDQRITETLRELAPKEADRKLPFWQDKVQRALEERDTDLVRGYLLAAPAMLGNELGRQVQARADAETRGSQDERVIRAALQKIPENVARSIEYQIGLPEVAVTPEAPPATEAPASGDADRPASEEEAEVLEAGVRSDLDWRFRLLGSFPDLAAMAVRWSSGDTSDSIVFMLTGIGHVQQANSDGLSEANARAVSLIKSASRSKRLKPEFQAYLDHLTSEAVPRDVLDAALKAVLSETATTEMRGLRVRDAFEGSIDPAGLARLEGELQLFDRIATLTSPSAALKIISHIEDGTDLKRARMLAEAGGLKALVLVEERGHDGLKVADAGVHFNPNMALDIMSLTAAGMLLFWVALSTVRIHIRKPEPAREPIGVEFSRD
ncbi:MAG: hypothetical protein ACK4HR_01945 [Hyphomonas sp.]|jgi:hypothetical protein